MTDRLRTLLLDAAEDARNYAEAHSAVASARRSRTLRRLLVVPLAASAVLIAIAVPLLWTDDRGPAPVSSGYPPAVAPAQNTPGLPSGRVGTASFIYAPCVRACDPFLVVTGGVQYTLPRSQRGESTASYTLSPDGRWLGRCGSQGCQVRDLEHNRSSDLADKGPGTSEIWAWSPDSTWLLLVRHVDGAIDHFETIKLSTGQRHRISGAAESPLAVNNDGALLYWKSSPAGTARLTTADVSSGALVERAGLAPQLGSQLRKGESVSTQSLRLVPGDDLVVLTVTAMAQGENVDRPTALLLVNRADGRVVRRLNMPPSDWTTGTGIWEPGSAQPEGILLVHAAQHRTEIVRLDYITGGLAVLSTLPRDSQLVLRGASRS